MREFKQSGINHIGVIPRNWSVLKGKYCYSIQSGYPFASDKFSLTKGFPLIRIRDITSGNTETFFDGEYDESYVVHSGDCIIGMDGDFNIRLWNNNDALLNQRCCRLISHENCIVQWFYYCLPFKLRVINDLAYSTTVKHLSNDDLLNAHIIIPSLEEQKELVSYLNMRCYEIDSLISRMNTFIERLREYKRSLITEVVTKGMNPSASMKDSGVEWIGYIPSHWNVYRVASLYEQTNEKGSEELPILTVSINSGISDRELDDDEQDRVFARSEDRTKYKRVAPGDLAYNMMRAWQGAFGAVRVDGMVSPAYITCRPKAGVDLDTRYIEYLFRSPMAIEEMHRHSHGVADFRLRLYWPEFKNIKLCLPPSDEQSKIADHIDKVSAAIDDEINRIQLTVNKLNDYKKSLIFEVVTGKKEIVSL